MNLNFIGLLLKCQRTSEGLQYLIIVDLWGVVSRGRVATVLCRTVCACGNRGRHSLGYDGCEVDWLVMAELCFYPFDPGKVKI